MELKNRKFPPAMKTIPPPSMYSYSDNKKGLVKTNPGLAGREERWHDGTMTNICRRKAAGLLPITFQEKVRGYSGGCQNPFALSSKYINVSA
jgi:hypothetical protein